MNKKKTNIHDIACSLNSLYDIADRINNLNKNSDFCITNNHFNEFDEQEKIFIIEEFLGHCFDNILERVAIGEVVSIKRFGIFSATMSKPGKIITPTSKGEFVEYEGSLVLRFRQSKIAKTMINMYAENIKNGIKIHIDALRSKIAPNHAVYRANLRQNNKKSAIVKS